jgi:hypothetical protein
LCVSWIVFFGGDERICQKIESVLVSKVATKNFSGVEKKSEFTQKKRINQSPVKHEGKQQQHSHQQNGGHSALLSEMEQLSEQHNIRI